MSPLKQSKNLAARMGRWSASHWKTATFGWLAFVIASFAVGIAVPMKMIEQKDAAVGEAGKANRMIDESFDLDKNGLGEIVIIKSKTKTVDDPAFRATVDDTITALSGFEQVENVRSPLAAGNEGQISNDRHAVTRHVQPTRHVRRGVSLHRLDRLRDGGRSEGSSGLLRRRGRRLDREGARQGHQRRDRKGRARSRSS